MHVSEAIVPYSSSEYMDAEAFSRFVAMNPSIFATVFDASIVHFIQEYYRYKIKGKGQGKGMGKTKPQLAIARMWVYLFVLFIVLGDSVKYFDLNKNISTCVSFNAV